MQNAKKFFEGIFSLGDAYNSAKADGHIKVDDLQFLLGPALKMPGTIAAAKPAFDEFKTGTPEQRNELCQWITSTFDITDDQLEAKIEGVLNGFVQLSALFAKPAQA